MRLLGDEVPEANSCVRTSVHDTVHDLRDALTCQAQLRCRGLRCPRRTQLCIEELRVRPIGPSCHAPAQNDEEGITQRPAAVKQPGA